MKPERDPLQCANPDCEREPDAVTPAGPMCDEHAREVADAIARDHERAQVTDRP